MAKTNSSPGQAPSKRGSSKSAGSKPLKSRRSKKKGEVPSTAGSDSHGDEESDEDELEEDGSGSGKKGAKKLIWDDELTWSLITCISENATIKQGLYPPPGQNTSTASSGGKPKSDFHLELARALFEDHTKYGELFAEAKGVPAKLAKWAGKIKNRLNTLEKKTRSYFEHMGETGQGIKMEVDIDVSSNSDLVNKWHSIKAAFPYYFEMLELIGQCPNIIHTGVGNSFSKVDVSAIMGDSTAGHSLSVEDVSSTPPSPTLVSTHPALLPSVSPPPSPSVLQDDNFDNHRPSRKRSASILSGISYTADKEEADLLAASIQAQSAPVEQPRDPVKTSSSVVATSKASKSDKVTVPESGKKTAAQQGTSTPASKGKGKGSSKKLKFGDQFVDVATAKEQTLQKKLDLHLSQTKLEKLKLEGKITVKLEKIRLKAEMQKLAMVQEHEEWMAKLGQRVVHRQVADARVGVGASSRAGGGFSADEASSSTVAGPSNFWAGAGAEDYWSGPFMGPPLLGDPLADPFTMGDSLGNGTGRE